MNEPSGSAEDLIRLRVHHRNGDGWLHCTDEYAARVVRTPAGPASEIRCGHWVDPLRYDLHEPQHATEARSLLELDPVRYDPPRNG